MNLHTHCMPKSACTVILLTLLLISPAARSRAEDVASLKAQLAAEETKKKQADAATLAAAQNIQRIRAKLAEAGSPVPASDSGSSPQDDSKPTPSPTAANAFYKFLHDDLGATIRRSLKDRNLNNLPALFQYTRPGGGDDFWTADIGLNLAPPSLDIADGFAGSKMQFLFDGEYHYNGSTAKRKDTLWTQAGLDMRWQGEDKYSYHDLMFTGGYRQDNVVAGQGWTAQAVYSPRLGRWDIGNRNAWAGLVEWRFQPYAGFGFESGDGAGPGFTKGERTSFLAGASLAANLFPAMMGNRLEWTNTLGYWHHLGTTGGYDAYDRDHIYWISSLKYWLDTRSDQSSLELQDADKHFGIMIQYTNGDNPDEGDFGADLLTVGFSVKL